MPDAATWVTDTRVYMHLCRAGHAEILERLAPDGIVLVPDAVGSEINTARMLHSGIPNPASTSWARVTVLAEPSCRDRSQSRDAARRRRPSWGTESAGRIPVGGGARRSKIPKSERISRIWVSLV